jgi:CHAT domain-containing protein/tetratricopeptide (TPR) repeat protein
MIACSSRVAHLGHLSWILIGLTAPTSWGQSGATPPAADRPVHAPRSLSDADTHRVKDLNETADRMSLAKSFTKAVQPARQVVAILEKALGPDHWRTGDARRKVENLERFAQMPAEGLKAAAEANDLGNLRNSIYKNGRYSEAERLDREIIAIKEKWLVNDRREIGRHYLDLGLEILFQNRNDEAELILRRASTILLEALGAKHPDVAVSHVKIASCLSIQGKYAEAEPMYRAAYVVLIETLGEEHPQSVSCQNDTALTLGRIGKYAEAEPIFRKVIAIRLKSLSPDDPLLASAYDNLGNILYARGKYAESESMGRKALDIRVKVYGLDHEETAGSFINLAVRLNAQEKYAEAEPLLRTALSIQLRILPFDHPYLYLSYANLGITFDAQGKFAEAEPMFRKALAIQLKSIGANHDGTTQCYLNLAINLIYQEKYAEAEPILKQALVSYTQLLGADHPESISTRAYLASSLNRQGKYAEAEPGFRKVLEDRVKSLGADHPDVAWAYNSLADNLHNLGREAEAEPMLRRALEIQLKTLGSDHFQTALTRNNLAVNLDARGRLAEAARYWKEAADGVEAGQFIGSAIGLERSQRTGAAERLWLAVALARQGQPGQAWQAVESDLARGLLDDLSARQLRPLTNDERRREADLLGQIQAIDEPFGKLATNPHRTVEEDRRLEILRRQKSDTRVQFLTLENELASRYRAFSGKPSPLGEVRSALPADTALVGWVDLDPGGPSSRDRSPYHWAWAIRADGDPIWVPIPGTGEKETWTKEDDRRTESLRTALLENQPSWRGLAAALARQRFDPLRPHLKGIKQIIVLPSSALAGIPIEVLVEARPPDAPRMRVSYAPSGSMFARVSRARAKRAGTPRLLALGDPAFPAPKPSTAPPPPDRGIALVGVAPNGLADLAGLRVGDVLLQYGDTTLKSAGDLKTVPGDASIKRIPVRFWRDGETRTIEVAAGPLGIRLDPDRTPAQVVLARNEAEEVLRPLTRGESWDRLPGTRREVETIAGLFPPGQVTTLIGDQATEPAVQELAATGRLKSYQFLHLATHGRTDATVAMNSALMLAPARSRTAASTAPETDGRITAQQIVNTWDLDADLVVLSACQTGLGRYAGGEGYLGFSQALFVKGARSVVLSLWEVNDESTQFLMQRFYQNLLGRRDGLTSPMPKAEALDEAKQWLRTLTVDQVADLTRSKPRPPQPSSAMPPTRQRNFDHPYFWAGFVLIGDPR